MNDYHKLEDPDVYKARRLAIEIADATVRNQMILREHSRYKLLREEVERQNIKEKALLQLSQQRNIQPNEKAVFENVLVNANRQPELNGGVSRTPLPIPPPPLSDEEDEPLLAEDDEDELPEMIQLYNLMDDEQLAIVLENFKVHIDNLDKEARNSLTQKGEDLIARYGSKINANVYDLIAELLEYIEEVEEAEEEEEQEEKAEEEEEQEEKPRETENLEQIKDYLKKKGFTSWGGLTKEQSIQILRAVGNVSDEQIQEQIKNFNKENQERRKGGQRSKRRRSRQEGNGITQGNGLIQLGKGIAQDLQKLIVMIGSKRSGNDSKALSKKIVALQKKIKKDIERKQKKETKAIEMEKTRQRIKKIAKESM